MTALKSMLAVAGDRLKHTVHGRAVEWLLAGISLTWGMMLLCNPSLFASRPYWAEMVALAPQSVWAWFVFLLGSVRFTALTINGAWRPTPHIRAVCAFLNVHLWLLITFAIGHSGAASLGISIYPWFMLWDGYSCFRAAGEAKVADVRAKLAA